MRCSVSRGLMPVHRLSFFSTQATRTSVLTHEHRLGESKADKARKERRALARSRQDISGSLVEKTLEEMDSTGNQVKHLSREERKARRRSLDGMPSFQSFLSAPLMRKPTSIFQINIGLYCNQACSHCHVESSPRRLKEQMTRETVDRCLKVLENSPSITTVDITGGAPELNKNFRYLVEQVRKLGGNKLDIIDRCNLTVLSEPGQEDLAQFLKENRVHVVASLPCYGPDNVDNQRGNGVFDRSIAALLTLNELGYGAPDSGLRLDLVYNPIGPFLPPEQSQLETQYKKQLDEKFGIQFNNLFCITNMPIKRFADFLHRRGELREYMDLLINNFNASTVDSVMCRDTLSVRYDGALYDCDFNQQLDLALHKKLSIFDISTTQDIEADEIHTRAHCFGCTSGAGSSCQGEVV